MFSVTDNPDSHFSNHWWFDLLKKVDLSFTSLENACLLLACKQWNAVMLTHSIVMPILLSINHPFPNHSLLQ